MFAGRGRAAAEVSLGFVAPSALDGGLGEGLALRRELRSVADTRGLTKADMPGNDALPEIRVDPDTFRVWIDGELVEPRPAKELPLAQRYFLF
jgi:urease subunit alpha